MKFVKKLQVVEAMRFNLSKDEKVEVFEEYPVFYDPDIETGVAYLRIATPDGSKRVDIGDWIVKTENGTISIHTPEEFGRLYENISENFEKNAEGFLAAYKKAMGELNKAGVKLPFSEVSAGEVEYKNGYRFAISVKISRIERVKEVREPGQVVTLPGDELSDSAAGSAQVEPDSKTASSKGFISD